MTVQRFRDVGNDDWEEELEDTFLFDEEEQEQEEYEDCEWEEEE